MPEIESSTWADLAALSDECGKASEGYDDYVGLTKKVALAGVGDVTVRIVGLRHDTFVSGETAGFTFQLLDGLSNTKPVSMMIDSSGTNEGGWQSCQMRTETVPVLLDALPEDLTKYICPIVKKSSTSHTATDVIETEDKLVLPSLIELVGTSKDIYTDNPIDGSNFLSKEGTHYEYWAGHTTKEDHNVLDDTGAVQRIWTRSIAPSSTVSFYDLYEAGLIFNKTTWEFLPDMLFCISTKDQPMPPSPTTEKLISLQSYTKQLGQFVSDFKASLGPLATVNAPGGEDTFLNNNYEFTDPTVATDVQYFNSKGQPVDANESDLFLRGDKTWANMALGPELPSQEEFEALSWPEIAALEGNLSSLVGFTKTVSMGEDFGEQTFQLVDTDCYNLASGSGKSKMVFLSKDCLTSHTQKQADSNVSTIWSASQVKTFCDTDLYNAMPEDLQAAIVEVNLPCFTTPYTYGSGTCPSLTNVKGKVFIPSVAEIFDENTANRTSNNYYPKTGTVEGTQYKYFALHNTDADRIKKYNGTAKYWWLRSPMKSSSAWNFNGVSASGILNGIKVNNTNAVAAGFCL